MSLILFHRVLILFGIVFCAGYAVWEFVNFTDGGGTRSLLIALGFLVAALGLGYYLRNLGRILKLK